MPKVDGLTPEQRKALVRDQLAEDGAEPVDLPPAAPVAPVVPVVPAVGADMTALIQALAAAIGQNNAATTEAFREALAANAKTARTAMPETYLNGGYPEHSVYSHPDGDLAHPRTAFRCPMFMGVFTEKGETIPAFEIFQDTCTEAERVAYNALVPGKYLVERNDGKTAHWRVIEQLDDLGVPLRLVVAVPLTWLKKDEQAQMPTQKSFLRQLTEAATVAA